MPQAQPAVDIARLLKASDDHVRDVIHAFNERRSARCTQKWNGIDRKGSMNLPGVDRVIARRDPRFLGQPLSGVSSTKLRVDLLDTQKPAAGPA
ncbi:hypothetical protein GCM10009681_35320 [Luedemannella helvata]|uniref:Uncharacterized protein n=1 Tax=Luedemannella helvata TaxID=349315 RepID=A0ABP4WVG9_9ACTN